jgi:hypothetical protein
MQLTTTPKRLLASRIEAQLIEQNGFVYLYPDALSSTALYVCPLSELTERTHYLRATGWRFTKHARALAS